ncbi:MAG: GNAT family N-acetyltransferase [Candidatus Nitrosopolaris sp.]|jgi:ribosomal protein S18 acetylase RimI-like enzyme
MHKITLRNIHKDDIPKIIALQKESFSDMAMYGMIWPSAFLENHLKVFPEGQLCVELNKGKIIASASSLIISLKPSYREHTWHEITGYGMFDNHDPMGDSLYGADISTHPKFQGQGVGTLLYTARKKVVIKLNLKRMIVGGRLYNYYKQTDKMTPQEYAHKVINGELTDPVLSFQLKNGFRFIKVLPNYLYDRRSVNYASFLEWVNPEYR